MARMFLLAVAVLLAGCHRYVPARTGSVPAGAGVRIHLSEAGARRVQELTGRESGSVTGDLERWAEDVVVSVPLPPTTGMLDRGLRQRIIVPAGEVVAVDVRELDRARTTMLGVGITAGVGVAAVAAFSGVFGGGRDPEPDLPEELRVPLLWIRIFP